MTAEAPPHPNRDHIVIQSNGMGVESIAILLRWIYEPASRPFASWDQVIIITAQVGEEHKNDTIRDMETHILPLLCQLGVRFVEVARRGPYEKDGIVVLQDTRQPKKLHPDGVYRLSDELLRSGTVPQFGGEHRCAMKFKAFVIESWLAFEFQRKPQGNKPVIHVFGYNAGEVSRIENSDKHIEAHNAEREIDRQRPPLMVFGFNSEEQGRIDRAKLYDGPSRTGHYPLQKSEWCWDREKCIAYIYEKTGIVWRKSHCAGCPFCKEAANAEEAAVQRWIESPVETAYWMLVEFNSLCFNPRGQLYKKTSLGDVVRKTAETRVGMGQVLVEYLKLLNKIPWGIYRVRRIYTAKGKAFRAVERIKLGDRKELEAEMMTGVYAPGAYVRCEHNIDYHRFDDAEPDTYPAVEGYYVLAPGFMEDKYRGTLDKFVERYERAKKGWTPNPWKVIDLAKERTKEKRKKAA